MRSALPDRYTPTETLHQNDRLVVYRAIRVADGRPVVLKVLDPHRCHPEDLDRLEREFELARALEPGPIMKPLALETYQGMPTLVLEDFGGAPLDRLLGEPMEMNVFLPLAIGAARAVADLHGQGVVHKDLEPANIFIRPSTLEVKIAGLGFATRLSREQQAARPPRLIEGSLPHLSPEQTGWMNRAVDRRSDLYSLGVSFYQMLTGRLPFEARDPVQWVHAHVARPPVPPSQVVPEVPEAISRIVLRLLAKMADDRYQSARGLEHDLERCLEQWRSQGRIDPFPLGERDLPERLQVPQKLYGREKELSALLAAFGRVTTTGVPELVLVSGYSGVGKSSLVRELQRPIVRDGGIFLSGKLDEQKRDRPYSIIVQPLEELVADILAGSEAQIREWRRRLREALGRYGQLVVDLIPRLELVVGRQPPVAPLGASEARVRFERVLRRLLGALAAKHQPVVLFLDDLQWADSASFLLVEQTITASETAHLLVVGAYRDEEVGPSHPLARTVRDVSRAGARVCDIALAPLSPRELTALLADTLHSGPAEVEPLADILHEKTGGNPFFALQFLAALEEEGLLAFDRLSGAWRWDAAGISAKGFTSNVVDFMAAKLRRLPDRTRELLELGACIGGCIDVRALSRICNRTEAEIDRELVSAVEEGLLASAGGGYRFTHDRVRQAAYLLIREGDRAAAHLRIGRLLLARTPPDEVEGALFDIASQLNLGQSLIAGEEEKVRVAELNLLAGQKARAAHACASAAAYLSAGARLLGPEGWESRYELAYRLHLLRAECEFVGGNPEEAARVAALTAEKARTRIERSSAMLLEQQALIVKGELAAAVEQGRRNLALFGIELPANPTWAEVLAERDQVERLLGGRPIESIVDLPSLEDPEREAALRVVAPSYFTNTNLYCLHVARMVAITLEHGNSDASALWYGSYSFVLAGFFGEYAQADRFAQAAWDLVVRRRAVAQEARGRFFLVAVSFWTRTLDEYVEHARAGFQAALESGDLTTASMLSAAVVVGLLAKGQPLGRIHEEADRSLDFQRKAGYRDFEDIVAMLRHFALTLQGRARSSEFDPDRFEASLTTGRSSLVVCWYWTSRLQASFLSGDFRSAVEASDRAKPLLWVTAPLVPHRDFHLYDALARAALFDEVDPAQREAWLETIADHERKLRLWAEVNPGTFRHGHALVCAENARIRGKHDEAARSYEESLRWAREGQFVQDEALAYEVATRFYRVRGFDAVADMHLREARSCYVRWGADWKVRQLERLHPHLAVEARPLTPNHGFAARPEHLDLLSIVKASQAISREVVEEKLVRTLMEVLLAQGGAEKGALVLLRDDVLSVEAEASLDAQGIQVQWHEEPPAAAALLPGSILRYAWRTGERVVLEDAAADRRFFDDEYVARVQPRSVLCLPVRRQSEVVGLVYLENDVLPGAFTPERLAALEVLAAQASISLENARLYRETRQALHLREEFLAVASHELRTPLATLALSLQNLERAAPGGRIVNPEAVSRSVKLAARQGDRLARLVSALLDVSRLELGRLPLDLEEVDLAVLVHDVVERFEPEWTRAGCSVSLQCDVPVTGRWDRSRVDQVVTNLLANAVKFGAGKPIEVAVREMPPGVARLEVRDRGIGIDLSEQKRIFGRFERAVSSEHYGGMGLGLYISRYIVEAHGGRIRFESQPGEGSTFVVELPRTGPPDDRLSGGALLSRAVEKGAMTRCGESP